MGGMTQYLLAVHNPPTGPDLTAEEMRQSFADTAALNDKMVGAGAFVFGNGLQPVTSAMVVRQSGMDFLVTDGPYVEAKEHVGGFWIIEAKSLDEALSWARQATVACRLPVELRPFMTEPPVLP
jgi:hypothetical protein